ncbi:MAG TPA: hypothetical protein PKJ99_04375 [Thermoanaerobaculales bacterium]|nr:hypothetical protein [Thermoanaerobaculales bacterium]HQL31346.1 hypothetical protein [Thermoanaerobaculales bacterium]
MRNTTNLRLVGMLALAVALAMASGAQAQQAPVDLTLGRPAPVGGPAAGGGPVPAGGTEAILDDFNRADGPIGAGWTVHDGYCNVVSNAAVCGGMGRATFNGGGAAGDTAEVDIATNGTALQYAGLLLNYGAGATNLFLKVQEQSSTGQFSNAACYTGNNGGAFGLGFFTLTSPFATAHMEATRSGSDVTIVFSNVDGGAQPDQTYVCTGAPAPEGTGIGIIGYDGIARMDNFGSDAIPVELMGLSVE